ncbi:MAG: hypothetical protein QOG64_2424 [Acidimicrobiaceae bacterium]|nr:hypothetical protein [Acidimicrobiaceae bacterium]
MAAPTGTIEEERPQGATDLPSAATDDGTGVDSGSAEGLGAADGSPEGGAVEPEVVDVPLRPLIVAACSSLAAALTVGGIFGSWGARAVAMAAALVGIGWSWLAARSVSRRSLYQALLPAVIVILAVLSLTTGAPGGPSALPSLVRQAIRSGHLLRPPIPFDAGWRPILIVLLGFVGYAAAAAGLVLERPRLGLVIPLPLVALTAISQPKDGQALAGLLAVLPVVAGLTVLFGGEAGGATELTKEFELRRVLKAGALLVPLIGGVLLLNSTSLLFPKPVYNPSQKPQKPKAVPISAASDRVLFEVDGPITGPWKMGSLDVYDGRAWRLPPFDARKLQNVTGDGVIDKTRQGEVTVGFTVRDLGTSASLPGVTGPTKIEVSGQKVAFDDRAGTFRVPTGRVPTDLSYKMSRPVYPTPEQLRSAPTPSGSFDKSYRFIPAPPPAVRDLLTAAPSDPWDRLDFVLKKLSDVEVAVGAGNPVDVPPSKIQQILAGNHEGSPYELVAAQAMLARWAGIPARIGFGFDGEQREGTVMTVRPKNAAQWLEVYFEGHGWIPIITTPPKAKASLDNDKNVKFNPTIQAGSDVAVQVYIPVKVKSLVLLYQQVRTIVIGLLPFALLLLAAYISLPWFQKTWRRTKRRRWAATLGPEATIAVEYADFRDTATDLGIGDAYATPIEYLDQVVEDDEHQELAWLVTKALYGELRGCCTVEDVTAARELTASLRQRLAKAQPLQTRILAMFTRLSLEEPYTTEVPAVRSLRLRRPIRRRTKVAVRPATAGGR